MTKLRDMIYNTSDILIAFSILIIAGIIIFTKIDIIMDYPAQFAAEESRQLIVSAPDINGNDALGGAGTTSGGALDGTTDGLSGNFALYINPGDSLDVIGERIVALEIFESVSQFKSAVETAGVATQIKTGNHILPRTATHDEIIKLLTKPGL